MKAQKVVVACPACGHQQPEPITAYSTVCKKCRKHYRVQEQLQPAAPAPPPQRDTRRVQCFNCRTELEVPAAAQSTMCKKCSSHVDLRDYTITNATSKNFKTRGRFVIEEGAYLFNTDTIANEVILKGRFLGKLTAEKSLEIYNTSELKGTFTANLLIIPSGQRFRWPDALQLGGADVSGELVANIKAKQTVTLRASARLFGDVEAGGLVVEPGAVFVGRAKITPA
jgi:cytoskeletal protein CcmA (bactofilin family)